MLSSSNLPKSFWIEPLKMRVYILNRVPTKVVPKMPFELWTVLKTSLRHMRVWGCASKVGIYNPQEKKLDVRTISRYFIGYVERSKGYRFYCPSHSTRIVESRNAKFLENDLNSGNYYWDQFPLSKFPSLFYFSIYFPSSIPTLIPLFFFPFSFPFLVTVLSRFKKKLAGSWIGTLTGLQLHPCSYIMSLINHFVIIYLTNFTTTGSRIQSFIFQVPRSPLYTQRLAIYIMSVRLVGRTEPLIISFLLFRSPSYHCAICFLVF